MNDLRYPIGKFQFDEEISPEKRRDWIKQIAQTPAQLLVAIEGLSEDQLDTPYREGGWTVRQVVHHIADSHMNAYIRFRLALTEEEPTIKPYHETSWANLEDARTAPARLSLTLIESLHDRWVRLIESFHPDDFSRTFRHPHLGVMTLERTLAMYAWHGRHHLAHISGLRERMGWR